MSAPQLNLNFVSALLVDPDPTSAKILTRMLEGFGLNTCKAIESSEAAQVPLACSGPM